MMYWLILRPMVVMLALFMAIIMLGNAIGGQLATQTLTLSLVKANWEAELVLLDIERSLATRWFIPGQAFGAQWSTDGARLALGQFVPPPPYPGDTVFVWERGVLSKPQHMQSMDFSWSPDSTQLAFSLNVDANFDVYVTDMDGTNRQRLTETPVDETLPRWSSDGRWLVYEVTDAFFIERYIQLHDLETGAIRPLTRDYSQIAWAAWSPTAPIMAYVRIVDDRSRIYLQNVASGEERALLPDFPGEQFSPTWSPDGSRLALRTNGAVYTVDLDGQNMRRVNTGAGHFGSTPAWSSDGKSLAYVEGRSYHTVYVIDATDEAAQPRAVHTGRLYYAPLWRPGK